MVTVTLEICVGPWRLIGFPAQVRVEQVFDERRGLGDEIHLNQMRAGLYRNAEPKRFQDHLVPVFRSPRPANCGPLSVFVQTLASSMLTSS